MDLGKIIQYYDENTPFFLASAKSARSQAIHRALWPPGVATLEEALNVIHHLISQDIAECINGRGLPAIRLLDLGCGVGDSLCYLATHTDIPTSGIGLTISPLQASAAKQAGKIPNKIFILVADFHHAPVTAMADVVYSIEAFIHSLDPVQFFSEVSRILQPGGRLVICDDFLETNPSSALATSASKHKRAIWLDVYRRGWHAPNLSDLASVVEIAEAKALRLVKEHNLTPFLRLRTLPEWLLQSIWRLGSLGYKLHPIIPSMVGSMALQHCLRNGWITYRYLVFEHLSG
jgi:cyclopropane fatty-acyl-phospholipid synthase-like methyltransferase